MMQSRSPQRFSPFRIGSWGLGILVSGYLLIQGSRSTQLLLTGRLVFYTGLLVCLTALALWLREARSDEEEEEDLPED